MEIKVNLNSNYQNEFEYLRQNISQISSIDEDIGVEDKNLKAIHKILNNNDLKKVCQDIIENKYLEEFTYQDLNNLYETLGNFFDNISNIKETIDIEVFFEKGNIIDIEKLKKKCLELDKLREFPNFNFDRLKELFENPPRTLKPQDNSSDEEIIYDPFVVRKYLYAIVQMVVNEMDLLIGITGSEGLGKSCACSQDINLLYYILKELNIIDYEYNIEDIWFNSLNNFIEAEDKFFDQKFRILGLDEGNELHRQAWQDELVKTFFQRLRRERHNQRIKFICLPQLGELMTAIVLSRMNFIFTLYGKDDVRTGTLDKGYCNFYIIPRNNKIYSPHQKREISKDEIVDTLGNTLDDKKKHLKKIPDKLIIKKYKRNKIWGFERKKYLKNLKETNKNFTVAKGIRLTEYQCYCYYLSRPKLKDWNVDRKEDKEIYATLSKMDKAICKMFDENPDKLNKYQNLMARKKGEL